MNNLFVKSTVLSFFMLVVIAILIIILITCTVTWFIDLLKYLIKDRPVEIAAKSELDDINKEMSQLFPGDLMGRVNLSTSKNLLENKINSINRTKNSVIPNAIGFGIVSLILIVYISLNFSENIELVKFIVDEFLSLW